MNPRLAFPGVFVTLALAAGAAAQAPAVSGLSPTPSAPAKTSGDWSPPPTPGPKLTGVAGPATEKNVQGQSLADVVRLSKEARKGQPPKKSLGTITNENLRKGGAAAPGTASAKPGTKGSAVAEARAAAPTPAPTYDVPRDLNGRSEAEWRVDAERRVTELDLKSKQLENDFYAQSDGYRRDGVIKPAWDKAREDLVKARADLEAARKAADDLQEEARRAGAPPGWLR